MPEKPEAKLSAPQLHKAQSPVAVHCGVITVSDTRTTVDDRGGSLILEMLAHGGHAVVARKIIPDDPQAIRREVQAQADRSELDAVLISGGTGIAPRDHTIDTVGGMLTRTIPGYGELFRMLSYQEIGPAAMLSRAVGGVIGSTILLAMPGSPAAVRLAMERLVLPELSHLVGEATKDTVC